MQEIWKDIEGYEGLYQVSNLGNVKSLNYRNMKKPHLLKPKVTHDGYYRLNLCKDGILKSRTIHILVARAFIPNPDNKPQVNHIDGNKQNNCVSNLEWVTGKENIRHAIDTGLRKIENHKYLKGSSHYASKPVLQYDLDGNFIKKWGCQQEAVRFYGCSKSMIGNAASGRLRTAMGSIWRYYDGSDIPLKISVVKTARSVRVDF